MTRSFDHVPSIRLDSRKPIRASESSSGVSLATTPSSISESLISSRTVAIAHPDQRAFGDDVELLAVDLARVDARRVQHARADDGVHRDRATTLATTLADRDDGPLVRKRAILAAREHEAPRQHGLAAIAAHEDAIAQRCHFQRTSLALS